MAIYTGYWVFCVNSSIISKTVNRPSLDDESRRGDCSRSASIDLKCCIPAQLTESCDYWIEDGYLRPFQHASEDSESTVVSVLWTIRRSNFLTEMIGVLASDSMIPWSRFRSFSDPCSFTNSTIPQLFRLFSGDTDSTSLRLFSDFNDFIAKSSVDMIIIRPKSTDN